MRLHRGLTAMVAIFALVAFAMAPATGYACGDKTKTARADKAEVIKANAGGTNCGDHARASVRDASAKSCDGVKTTTASADKAKDCSKPCDMPCPGARATTASAKACCMDKGASVTTSAATPASAHTLFGVAYMVCSGCEAQVAEAIKKVEGVRSVGVCHKSGIADVDFDSEKCSSNDIVKAIENAGYHAQEGAYSAEELKSFADGNGNAKVSNASAGAETKAGLSCSGK